MSKLKPTLTNSNPTATDIVRRMLDERGVEWWQKKRHTCWKVSKGQEVEMWRAWEAPNGSLTLKVDYIYGLTPAQAIAATLGLCNCSDSCTNSERTETCHEIEDEDTGFIVCSECGAVHDESYTAYYCWCCGRKVVDDGKPSDAFRKAYPTIKTIIFEVNGKRYEYDAERFFALLDWWKEYGHVLMDERMGEVTDGRP